MSEWRTYIKCTMPTATINESNKANYISDPNMKNVEMYNTDGAKLFYQRTLVFPLRKAGDFKSTVKDLKIWNYVK